MTRSSTSDPQWSQLLSDPWGVAQTASSYLVDAAQRSILYADIERQVGDQYQAQLSREAPHVLNFPYELVLAGRDLPRPVNYGLMRIIPGEGQATDESKRPFVVVDPRAGHGPGIGGFKPESEIGAALNAGHPCYFVGFLPDPVPGQTIEDVMRAETEFVRRVAELHPQAQGKPAVIGNCQAGWQVLMAASVWPDVFGPIIVAGAPVSYWAGDNVMRYGGGLTGGSWVTALSSDLGNGRFDGASLVQNFENLDPANTLWSKQYKVYANADTEAERYIGFEKYWGGYVFLNDVEIQYIVDNLFIGNKLSTAQLLTSDGVRIDLRNIRSPIVVFCSHGDNITPPGQALGWITDLYRDDPDVYGHDQTIVYATHDSIGHLGIFVSSSVGSKEHRKFANTIDQIDMLPTGIYRATVKDAPGNAEQCNDPHLLSIRRSNLEEVRAIVEPDPESDRRFSVAAQISDINLALYRSFAQPWVKAFTTSFSAQWMQALHPLRLTYAGWTSEHPLAPLVQGLAEQVRMQRAPVQPDNPFLRMQEDFSQAVEHALDQYREQRDQIQATWFQYLFDSPWLRALAGQATGETEPARVHPGASPEHREFMREVQAHIEGQLYVGGLLEASLRALFYVLGRHGEVDERHFHHATRLPECGLAGGHDYQALRRIVREQALICSYHGDKVIDALPGMLQDAEPDLIDTVADFLIQIVHAAEERSPTAEQALECVVKIYRAASDSARKALVPATPQKAEVPAVPEGAKAAVAVTKTPRAPAAKKAAPTAHKPTTGRKRKT